MVFTMPGLVGRRVVHREAEGLGRLGLAVEEAQGVVGEQVRRVAAFVRRQRAVLHHGCGVVVARTVWHSDSTSGNPPVASGRLRGATCRRGRCRSRDRQATRRRSSCRPGTGCCRSAPDSLRRPFAVESAGSRAPRAATGCDRSGSTPERENRPAMCRRSCRSGCPRGPGGPDWASESRHCRRSPWPTRPDRR